jgi:hypothetical protein
MVGSSGGRNWCRAGRRRRGRSWRDLAQGFRRGGGRSGLFCVGRVRNLRRLGERCRGTGCWGGSSAARLRRRCGNLRRIWRGFLCRLSWDEETCTGNRGDGDDHENGGHQVGQGALRLRSRRRRAIARRRRRRHRESGLVLAAYPQAAGICRCGAGEWQRRVAGKQPGLRALRLRPPRLDNRQVSRVLTAHPPPRAPWRPMCSVRPKYYAATRIAAG